MCGKPTKPGIWGRPRPGELPRHRQGAAHRPAGQRRRHPPGYGFLSENSDFATACEQRGLRFIGPSGAAILAMGDKSGAKALMQAAGVPVLPGYHGADQHTDFLRDQASQVGFPLLIKAASGGGGKGMRRVDQLTDF